MSSDENQSDALSAGPDAEADAENVDTLEAESVDTLTAETMDTIEMETVGAPDAESVNPLEAVTEDALETEVLEDNDAPPLDSDPPAPTIPAGDVSRAHLKGLIEALVFVADRPLSVNDIAKAAGKADRKLVRALVDELRGDYSRRGIHMDEVAGGIIFRTNAAYGPFIRDAAAQKPVRMTRAQLEALAIIAYRQPLTRPDVDEIRGVDSGPVMKMLLERDLIKILGKKDEPGRPLLYGTTPVFLEFFGLKSLKDLPSLREFTDLSDDSRRVYDREMAEAGEETAAANVDSLAAAALGVAAEDPPADAPAPAQIESSEEGDDGAPTDRPTDPGSSMGDRPTDPDSLEDAGDPDAMEPDSEGVRPTDPDIQED